jgi:hypothetical protein
MEQRLMWQGLPLLAALLLTRVSVSRVLPLRLLSTDSAVTIGVLVYFVLPVMSLQDQLALSWWEYSLHIWGAYAGYILGAMIGRKIALGVGRRWGRMDLAISSRQLSAAICVLLVGYLGWRFYADGGPQQVVSAWMYGDIHRASLNTIEALEKDTGMTALGASVFQIVFVLLWTIVSSRSWLTGGLLWVIYMGSNLTGYMGRSAILGLLILPYVVYLRRKRRTPRQVVLLSLAILAAGMVFGSWMSWFRLGAQYSLSLDRVYNDTVRDAAGPMAMATVILENPAYRGSAVNYIGSLVFFVVPRALWPEKPGNEMNTAVTRLITGRTISRENSVITFTILGEGWFYFGAAGGVLLMMLMGGASWLAGEVLSRSHVLSGAYALVLVQTLFQLRSTLLYYIQYLILLTVVSWVVLWILARLAPEAASMPQRQRSLRCVAAKF